jgi:RES domain-containing protein
MLMVYLAESPAGALLEICAHTLVDNLPSTFTLLKITGPDISVDEIALTDLPHNWVSELTFTQRIGIKWVESGRTALLRVPSALVPETWNYLLNPLHPDAGQFQIERSYQYPFDLRLKN